MAEADDVKAERERKMFGGFAEHTGLNIALDSIGSCNPPLPDIRCLLDWGTYFFELAEVVPQDLAKALGAKRRVHRWHP